jgi:hypothetical protein
MHENGTYNGTESECEIFCQTAQIAYWPNASAWTGDQRTLPGKISHGYQRPRSK